MAQPKCNNNMGKIKNEEFTGSHKTWNKLADNEFVYNLLGHENHPAAH